MHRTKAGAAGRIKHPSQTRTKKHPGRALQIASVRRRLARRSLKPQLNQIRTWVRQGRTDAWIAHQLEVSVSDIRGFKREHGLSPAEGNGTDAPGPGEEELDLRAEDDALVAAALEAEDEPAEDEPEEAEEAPRRRRRGRRGGRRRRRPRVLEGTFDHGQEGYGLWLDPTVQDDPIYAEHWAGHRPVTVAVEPDRIVITRAGEEDSGADEEDEG
jgi:hypothetical protein